MGGKKCKTKAFFLSDLTYSRTPEGSSSIEYNACHLRVFYLGGNICYRIYQKTAYVIPSYEYFNQFFHLFHPRNRSRDVCMLPTSK